MNIKLLPIKCLCNEPLRIVVTGAANQMAHYLLYTIAQGAVFGIEQPFIFHLMDSNEKLNILEGISLALYDCAFPLLQQIVVTSDMNVAFEQVQIAFLADSDTNRNNQLSPKELLKMNGAIFKAYGKALDQYADKNVKVIVISKPRNTNCLICAKNAPSIAQVNFTALTRLDQNRAHVIVARKLNVPADAINNIIIWGNHASSLYSDATYATFTDGKVTTLLKEKIDKEILHNELMANVQSRDLKLLEGTDNSSAMAIAKAACDHMRNWWLGTQPGQLVCMGVISDGTYDIPADICFSYPVQIKYQQWTIVPGLKIDTFALENIATSINELQCEKRDAAEFIKS